MLERIRLTKTLLRFLMQRREIFLHSGLEPESGQPLTVLSTTSRHPFNMSGLLSLMFGEEEHPSRALGPHRIISLRRLQARHAASFACIEFPLSLSRPLGAVLSRSRAVLVPWFVETVAEVSDEARKHWSGGIRGRLRRAERDGYTYSVSTEREHFAAFVNDYWRPLVDRRFRKSAIDMGYQRLVNPSSPADAFRDLQVLRVFKEDRWVSGALLRTRRDESPELLEVGVLNGDASLVRADAQTAAYGALFNEVKRRGYEKVSLMWNFPDLAGGILRYKLQYRPWIRLSRYPLGVAIVPGKRTAGADSFLLHHPLIRLQHGEPVALFFSDGRGEIVRSKDLLNEGHLRGLRTPEIVPLDCAWN